MSRKDARKGLEVRLPESLRLGLVASTDAHLPLSYLARQVLRVGLSQGVASTSAILPGTARPIFVQLSPVERIQLEEQAVASGVSVEVALLRLLDTVLSGCRP